MPLCNFESAIDRLSPVDSPPLKCIFKTLDEKNEQDKVSQIQSQYLHCAMLMMPGVDIAENVDILIRDALL